MLSYQQGAPKAERRLPATAQPRVLRQRCHASTSRAMGCGASVAKGRHDGSEDSPERRSSNPFVAPNWRNAVHRQGSDSPPVKLNGARIGSSLTIIPAYADRFPSAEASADEAGEEEAQPAVRNSVHRADSDPAASAAET